MLSRKRVRAAIDVAEESILRCWSTLCKIKNQEVNWQEILGFQPLLGATLLELDLLYHEAAREKKRVIAGKGRLSAKWFKHRLALLDYYQRLITASAKRGRIVGDNFAWLFYAHEELRIIEHQKHDPVTHISSGVGGAAEVEFVKRFPLINERFLPIYHATTTFLRVGDVSLIDLRTLRLAGLGELKAGPEVNGEVEVRLYIAGANALSDNGEAAAVRDAGGPPKDFSPERLRRQLGRMAGLLSTSGPEKWQKVRLAIDYSRLAGIEEEAISAGISFRQLSPTLAVAVSRFADNTSLYSRLTKGVEQEALERLDSLPERLLQLATEATEDNAIWISNLSLHYLPGTTPILWTAVPVGLVDKVFRERVAVNTFYNPARFIQQLRAVGFEVDFLPDGSGLRLTYVQGELRIEIQNSDYFVRLVQDHLVEESTVVQCILDLMRGMDPQQLRPGMTIDFVPVRGR